MYIGRRYSIQEFLYWTRREIYALFLIAVVPTLLYKVAGWKWMVIPWLPVALLGTAVAFLVGFKNNASYDRAWEARRAWGAIVNSSRSWGIMVRHFVTNQHAIEPLPEGALRELHRQFLYRHIAWLTALRYQLREPRNWENAFRDYNVEYRRHYTVAEHDERLAEELARYLTPEDCQYILTKKSRAAQIISLQSKYLLAMRQAELLTDYHHVELERLLAELYNQQGVCERLKNYPYPRQFSTLNLMFVKLFVVLVPFGMLQEFQKLGEHLVWLNIPFSALVSWVFVSIEKIGENTENPFEGGANDAPITTLSRTIEIDLRDMLDEENLPPALQPVHDILL